MYPLYFSSNLVINESLLTLANMLAADIEVNLESPLIILSWSPCHKLNGILLGIKTRVQQQLIKDFTNWCESN